MKLVSVLIGVALLAAPPVVLPGFGAAYACPPGLAKKDPPCIPPGQARKGARIHVAERDALYFLDDYPRYDLPGLPDGQRYAVVDDRIVVIDAESYEILQLIRVFRALAN